MKPIISIWRIILFCSILVDLPRLSCLFSNEPGSFSTVLTVWRFFTLGFPGFLMFWPILYFVCLGLAIFISGLRPAREIASVILSSSKDYLQT